MPAAKELEQGNWTRFTPHYMVSPCPPMYQGSAACSSQCVQDGKYCAPDPDGSILEGYSGAEVVQVACQPVACVMYHVLCVIHVVSTSSHSTAGIPLQCCAMPCLRSVYLLAFSICSLAPMMALFICNLILS